MFYLLASKHGIKTGRTLAKMLDLQFESNINRTNNDDVILIRYGNAQNGGSERYDFNVNSRESILRASAKHKLWEYLQDVNIEVPRYYPVSKINKQIIDDEIGYPFLGRERLHRAGKDIILINDGDDIPRRIDFAVPFYKNILREYRVHVMFGKVVKLFRKYPKDDKAHDFIKTSDFGWTYKRADLDKVLCANSLVDTAITCAEVLGLEFCGIDMGWSSKENGLGRWVVFEVNSAPSLNSLSLELYVENFKNILTERYKEEKDEIYKSRQNNVGVESSN